MPLPVYLSETDNRTKAERQFYPYHALFSVQIWSILLQLTIFQQVHSRFLQCNHSQPHRRNANRTRVSCPLNLRIFQPPFASVLPFSSVTQICLARLIFPGL